MRNHLQTTGDIMTLYRIRRWLIKRYTLAANFIYYVRLGYGWRFAWRLARRTL